MQCHKSIKLLYKSVKDTPSLPLQVGEIRIAQAHMAVNSCNSFVSAYSWAIMLDTLLFVACQNMV